MKGFQVLIEKDWVSFGHKFLDRCGHLSSEKFFVAPVDISGNGGGAEAAQAFFASVQNKFTSQKHLQEMSPVFHQFLESVRQVQRQFPDRFEFNERYLRQIHYHLYSCQFGTFLFNSERERRIGEGGLVPSEKTASVWDFLNSPPETELNLNPDYDPSLDDPARRESGADMGVLFPNPKDVRFWCDLYGRTDEEMNGKFVTRQVAQGPEFVAPIETAEDDPATLTGTNPPSPSISPQPTSATASPSLSRVVLQRSASPSVPLTSSQSLPSPGTKHESLRGHGKSSASLGPYSVGQTPRSPSPNSRPMVSRSQPSPRPSASELFSSGGVRSMWGRFSSNASAALSAVQDAYGGVAKDLGKLSFNAPSDGQSREGGGELKSREELGSVWATSRTSTPSPPPVPSTASTTSSVLNPWDTTKPSNSSRPTVSSTLFDNPWSQPVPDPKPSPLANTLVESPSTLPPDPTVAHPTPIPSRRPTSESSTRLSSSLSSSITEITVPSPIPSAKSLSTETSSQEESQAQKELATDPLGVGVW